MNKIIPITNVIDREMPKLKEGQVLCDNCWAVSDARESGWMTFNFKFLKQTRLCPKCVPLESRRLTELQAFNL